MAGDWIKVDCDLPDKPEVDRIADLCGMSPTEVIGRLILLWVFVDRHCIGPVTKNVTPVTLCRRMQCDRSFLDALVAVEWLAYDDNSVTIPGWELRFSDSAKSRARATLRKRAERIKTVTKNVTRVTKTCDQRREEKRREELNTPIVPKRVSDAERIYAAYPRKVGKDKALAKIEAAIREKGVTAEALLEAVEAFTRATLGADPQFIPHPATWFNQGRWNDDRADWERIGRDGKRAEPRKDSGTTFDPDAPPSKF